MTELPRSILLSPLNRISCGKASSPLGQLEGCVEKLSFTKVAFMEQLSPRILHNGHIEQRGLCGLQMCIPACHEMTNMVCRRLYCQTSTKIALEHFDQHIAHRDVCGECLQEKKTPTSGVCWSLYPVFHVVSRKMLRPLAKASHCGTKCCGCKYSNTRTKMWHVGARF